MLLNVDLGLSMAYSLGMEEQWLEVRDGPQARRIPLSGSLTRLGGAGSDVSMPSLPEGEVHVWSDPPKVVLVTGDATLSVNGAPCSEALLVNMDLVQWGECHFVFRSELSAPVIQEIPVGSPATPSAGSPGDGGGVAWSRVRAGMYVELGLCPKSSVKTWQESVMRGEFSPDACARDLSAGVDVDDEDPRLMERSSRLLRDFLMTSAMSGVSGARRKARQVSKKGAAIIVSQLFLVLVYTLVILVAMLLLHVYDRDLFFDGIFDMIVPPKET